MTWVAQFSFKQVMAAMQGQQQQPQPQQPTEQLQPQQLQPQQPTEQLQPQQLLPHHLDWLLVPGGVGTRALAKGDTPASQSLLEFIRFACDYEKGSDGSNSNGSTGSGSDGNKGLSLIMSVCTGAALLAAAGVLNGRCAVVGAVVGVVVVVIVCGGGVCVLPRPHKPTPSANQTKNN